MRDDDLDPMLDRLRAHADRARLVQPSALRAEGTRRQHTRAALGVAAIALVVVGGLAAGTVLRPSSNPAAATASATAVVPTGAPASATPSPSVSTTTSIPADGAPCTAADLRSPADAVADGGMGSAFLELTITNQSGHPCTLHGVPTLWGTTGGKLVKLPQRTAAGVIQSTVLVPAGHTVSLPVRTVNGYGGYQSGSPQCAHPATYRGLELELGDGGARYRTGTDLDITCGDAEVAAWSLA